MNTIETKPIQLPRPYFKSNQRSQMTEGAARYQLSQMNALPEKAVNPKTLALRFGIDLSVNFDTDSYLERKKELSFEEYFDLVKARPKVLRTTHQRIYDMIFQRENEEGPSVSDKFGRPVRSFKFFTNPLNPKDALVGIEEQIDEFVQYIEEAAMGTDAGKSLVLFVGGPGSGKSTLVRILREGMEEYSKSVDGEMFGIKWAGIPAEVQAALKLKTDEFVEQVNAEPIYLLSKGQQKELLSELNGTLEAQDGKTPYELSLEGELPPASKKIFDALLAYEKEHAQPGEDPFINVLKKYVKARRLEISKSDRIGVGSFEADDEKSLDSTQLTGNMNMLGGLRSSEDDPLAFDFKAGELFAAKRGIMEFIEFLKLDKSFLYKILSLNEEKVVKPSKMPQTFVDELVIAHCNKPEYEKKKADPEMDAIMKRMKIIKFPYNLEMSKELEIYKRSVLSKETQNSLHKQTKRGGVFVAPHTLEVAALWSILTRIAPSIDQLDPLKKALLYDGERDGEYGPQYVREMLDAGQELEEGMDGIAPRELTRKILPKILSHPQIRQEKSVDGYAIIKIIEERIKTGDIKLDAADKDKCLASLTKVKKYLDEKTVKDVDAAVAGDKDYLNNILRNYLANVKAYVENDQVNDWRHGKQKPDESLMKALEAEIGGVSTRDPSTYRAKLIGKLGAQMSRSKFDWDTITIDDVSDDIIKAIIQYAAKKLKDTLPPAAISSGQPLSQRDAEDRLRIIKNLCDMGYNEETANNALLAYHSIQTQARKTLR